MLFQEHRAAPSDPDGLESGGAAKERLVVAKEHRLAGIDKPAPCDAGRQQGHRSTPALPIEASNGRALTHDSSISASGSESQTIPPPTQRWICPSAIANVRIVRARSRSPFG